MHFAVVAPSIPITGTTAQTMTVDTITANTEVATDSVRAASANEVTINDNLIVTGDLTVNGSIAGPFFI